MPVSQGEGQITTGADALSLKALENVSICNASKCGQIEG